MVDASPRPRGAGSGGRGRGHAAGPEHVVRARRARRAGRGHPCRVHQTSGRDNRARSDGDYARDAAGAPSGSVRRRAFGARPRRRRIPNFLGRPRPWAQHPGAPARKRHALEHPARRAHHVHRDGRAEPCGRRACMGSHEEGRPRPLRPARHPLRGLRPWHSLPVCAPLHARRTRAPRELSERPRPRRRSVPPARIELAHAV